jgi:hypothetical protein
MLKTPARVPYLVVAAKNALDKIYNADKAGRLDGHWTRAHRYAEQAFHKAILQLCDEIIQAAKAKVKPPSSFREQREKQTAARKALADELRAGRRKLRDLQDKIVKAEEKAEQFVVDRAAALSLTDSYPEIPLVPRFRPNKVEYVGKSVRLKPRSPRQRKESPTPPRYRSARCAERRHEARSGACRGQRAAARNHSRGASRPAKRLRNPMTAA